MLGSSSTIIMVLGIVKLLFTRIYHLSHFSNRFGGGAASTRQFDYDGGPPRLIVPHADETLMICYDITDYSKAEPASLLFG